jgi:hypothetical protein
MNLQGLALRLLVGVLQEGPLKGVLKWPLNPALGTLRAKQ